MSTAATAPALTPESTPFVPNAEMSAMSGGELDSFVRQSIGVLATLSRQGQKEMRERLMPALLEVKRRFAEGQAVAGFTTLTAYLRSVGLTPAIMRGWEFRLREEQLKQLFADMREWGRLSDGSHTEPKAKPAVIEGEVIKPVQNGDESQEQARPEIRSEGRYSEGQSVLATPEDPKRLGLFDSSSAEGLPKRWSRAERAEQPHGCTLANLRDRINEVAKHFQDPFAFLGLTREHAIPTGITQAEALRTRQTLHIPTRWKTPDGKWHGTTNAQWRNGQLLNKMISAVENGKTDATAKPAAIEGAAEAPLPEGEVLPPKKQPAIVQTVESAEAPSKVPSEAADVVRLDDDDGGFHRYQLSAGGKRYIATILPDNIIMWDEDTKDGEKEVTRTGVKRRLGHLLRAALKARKAAAAAGGMQ